MEILLKQFPYFKYFIYALDIIIVTIVIYKIYVIVAETRIIQVLKGLTVILVAFWLAKLLELRSFLWLLERGLEVATVALIILFQPELRRFLIKLGDNKIFRYFVITERTKYLDNVAEALVIMSLERIGALIVFERNAGLKTFIETGTTIDAAISVELLITIFSPNTALHDGAVILQNERISAAGCFLPLTDRADLDKKIGTRHRAALGVAEQTDAVAVIVSEETGKVSLAVGNEFYYGLNIPEIRTQLEKLIIEGTTGSKSK